MINNEHELKTPYQEMVEKIKLIGISTKNINKGRKLSDEWRQRISIGSKGKHMSEDTKRKMSISHSNVPLGIEHKQHLSESHKNQRPTEKHKQQISEALKGHSVSKETRQKIGLTLKGRILPPEHRKNISLSLMGEKHPLWLGGKSFEPYTKEFNEAFKQIIRIRDNYTCQLCSFKEEKRNNKNKNTENPILNLETYSISFPANFILCNNMGKLSIHHIDYNKENTTLENCISLCRNCNSKVNTNRKYWTEYFINKQTVVS